MWVRGTIFAALVASAPCLLTASPAHADDVKITDKARALFREGVDLLGASGGPRYAEAYSAFKKAYAESPSPKILGNIGLCATKLERDGEAIEAYETYLESAGAKSPREEKEIERDLDALKKRVAYLTLKMPMSRAVVVDTRDDGGSNVVNRYDVTQGTLRLGLRAGRHVVTVEAPDREPEDVAIDLKPGDDEERTVFASGGQDDEPDDFVVSKTADPDDADGGSWSTAVWIGVAFTGAGAIATGVVGGLAAGNRSDYDAAIDAGDTAKAQELFDDGQTLNTTGDVLLGVTAGLAAATAVFVILYAIEDDEEPAIQAHVGPAYLGVSGRF